MSKTELLLSLSNLLLPSPPYVSKQQGCHFFWYSQKLHQESSCDTSSHTCFQTVSESYWFSFRMSLGSDHCLPPPPPPACSEPLSRLTQTVARVLPGIPACKSLARHTGHFHRVVSVIPSKPRAEQATSLLQTL